MIRFALACFVVFAVVLIVSVVNCLIGIDAFRPSRATSNQRTFNASFISPLIPPAGSTHKEPSQVMIITRDDTFYTYCGLIHFHTTYSDGSGSYGEITALAGSLDVDFIMPADHNTVEPFSDGRGGYHNDVLVIPAVESSADHGAGHFLIAGATPPLVRSTSISSDSVFHHAAGHGLITILAHVHHPRHNDWDNWDIGPFTGMEIFNLDENWRAMLAPQRLHRFLAGLAVYRFNGLSMYETVTYPARQLATFDRLNRERKVVGIGSTDAHACLELNDNNIIRFPSYRNAFSMVRTYLLTRTPYTGDYTHDRDLTLRAIREGNSYTGFPALGDPAGFVFTADTASASALMGDSLLVRPGETAAIRCTVPDSTEVAVVVRRDGGIIAEYSDIAAFSLTIDTPGAYRIEVFHTRRTFPLFTRRRRPFILSNPLYVYTPAAINRQPAIALQ